jgi:hypothetical protein
MAKQPKTSEPKIETVVAKPCLVAGHGVSTNGSCFVIFKDKVSVNPKWAPKGVTMTGTRYLSKGVSLEDAIKEFPLGMKSPDGAHWGSEVEDTDLNNVYAVLFEGEEEEEED